MDKYHFESDIVKEWSMCKKQFLEAAIPHENPNLPHMVCPKMLSEPWINFIQQTPEVGESEVDWNLEEKINQLRECPASVNRFTTSSQINLGNNLWTQPVVRSNQDEILLNSVSQVVPRTRQRQVERNPASSSPPMDLPSERVNVDAGESPYRNIQNTFERSQDSNIETRDLKSLFPWAPKEVRLI